MNWTRLAAALMGLTVFLHVFGGGPEVYDPLQAALSDPFLAAFAAVLWHMVTLVLIVLAGGIWVLARRQDPALEAILSGIQLGFAALFVFYGLARLGTVMPMSQWIIFLIIPGMTRFGQSRRKNQ
jgi:fumarate reductase subunit D